MLEQMYAEFTYSFFIWSAVVGLVLGSFLNVVIYRLPIIEELVELEKNLLPKTLWGRSHCSHCGSQISWYNNIPIISWLFLRGKTSCCEKAIHWRYPFVEFITGGVSVFLMSFWGPTAQYLFFLLLSSIAICLIFIDIDHMMLPDKLTLSFLWLVLIFAAIGVYGEPGSAILGACFGYFFLWLISFVFKVIYKKDGVGCGDMKLLAAIGALTGWMAIPVVMMTTLAIFALYAVILRINKETQYPFGPFIIAGALFWPLASQYI